MKKTITMLILAMATLLGTAHANNFSQVGIGTDYPYGLLHIQKQNYNYQPSESIILENVINDNGGSYVTFQKSRQNGGVAQNGDRIADFQFEGAVPFGYNGGMAQRVQVNGTPLQCGVPTDMIWETMDTTWGQCAFGERMRLTSTGKLGIGAASPAAPFHVKTISGYLPQGDPLVIYERSSNDTLAALFSLRKSRTNLQVQPAAVVNLDTLADIRWEGFDGSQYTPGAKIWGVVNGTVTTGNVPASMVFLTNNVGVLNERMRISPQGYVGISTTGPTHLITLGPGAYSNGTRWIDASSRELKDNITELPVTQALQALKELRPVTFTYKSDATEHSVGFIAEDVPALVATKDRKSLSAMDIIAVLTKAVQQQEQTIEKQNSHLDEIKAKIANVEHDMQTIKGKNLTAHK